MIKKLKKEEQLLNIFKQLEYDLIDDKKFIKYAENIFNVNNVNLTVTIPTDLDNNLINLNEYFLIIYDPNVKYSLDDIENALENTLNRIKVSDIKDRRINIVEIFDSILDRNQVNSNERIKKLKDRVCQKLKSKSKTISVKNISYISTVIVEIANENKMLEIEINDRVRSLEQKHLLGYLDEDKDEDEDKKKVPIYINSYVFTASLNSIIDLYNVFGDDLFSNNVRIGGLNEHHTNVDKEIQNTYINNPDEFWYLNNGISLFVELKNTIDFNVFNRIKFQIKDIEDISVINGAQTINSLSQVYNEGGNCKKDAFVILRMYVYKKTGDAQLDSKFKEFSEKVTVSLNRQKPIKQADLAYITNFVKNINTIKNYQNGEGRDIDNFTFDLVRRGENDSTVLCQYTLESFSKIVKAYLDKKPGESRGKSYNSLLKLRKSKGSDTTPLLEDKNIFVEYFQNELLKMDDIKDHNVEFMKYYGPVNFAFKLKKYLDEKYISEEGMPSISILDGYVTEFCKGKKIDEDAKNLFDDFSKYGTLIMVSGVINILNKFNDNFESWNWSLLKSKNTKEPHNSSEYDRHIVNIDEYIDKVLDYVLQFHINNFSKSNDTDKVIYDINFWKKDKIMNYIEEQYKSKPNGEDDDQVQ